MIEKTKFKYENAQWVVIKKDKDKIFSLFEKLAEVNGGTEQLKKWVKDKSRTQKLCGIRKVFDSEVLPYPGPNASADDIAEWEYHQTNFDRGFSRYLRTEYKTYSFDADGTKHVHVNPTFRRFNEMCRKLGGTKTVKTPVETKVNDDFSVLDSLFVKDSVDQTIKGDSEVDGIVLMLRNGAKTIQSPSGWTVTA